MEAVLPAVWYIRRQMRGHRGGLTLPQFRILLRIRREPEASLSALADHLGASLSTVSRAVTTLVDKGFLARTDSVADRRQLSLTITPGGQSVLNKARRLAQVQMAEIFEPLDARQREALIECMRQVRRLFTGDVALAEGLGYLDDSDDADDTDDADADDAPGEGGHSEGGGRADPPAAESRLIPTTGRSDVK